MSAKTAEVKIRLPAPLKKLSHGKTEIICEGSDVKEAICNIDKKFPGITERILDENGNIRRFINVFVNGQDIRFLNGDKTKLKNGDEISIIPAIAGG
jgi:molybdopterin synthase sulfur carrier subunit